MGDSVPRPQPGQAVRYCDQFPCILPATGLQPRHFYLGVGRYGRGKDALLIAHGVTEEGKRVLLGVYFGEKREHPKLERGLARPCGSRNERAVFSDHRWESGLAQSA